MKKIALFIIFISIIFFSCNGQNPVDKIGEEAVQLFADGDVQGALLKFEEIIEIDSRNSEAYVRRGDCLGLLGDENGSIESYSKAIEINPNKIAFYNRALSHESLGEIDKATTDYLAAIQTDPENSSELNNKLIYHNLGILYGQQNKLNLAIDAFTEAINIDEQYADAYHNRGYAYYLKNEYERAIENYDMALIIDPKNMFYKASKNVAKAMKN